MGEQSYEFDPHKMKITFTTHLWDKYVDNKTDNMEETKTGVLNRDFIKAHIDKETELENKIFELQEELNAVKAIGNENGESSLIVRIFYRMLESASINVDHGLSYDHYDHSCRLTVSDVFITEEEARFIQTIAEKNNLYLGANKNYYSGVNYGLGGTPKGLQGVWM